MSDIKELYQRICTLPWPTLAGSMGDFALYESLLIGCADRAVRGDLVDASDVPKADDDTVAYILTLRQKPLRSDEETDFLKYFDLLEEIRSFIIKECPKDN